MGFQERHQLGRLDRLARQRAHPGGGEWFRIEREGASLLHATRRTHATLTAPTPVDYARSITMTPAGTSETRVLYQRSSMRGWPHSWASAFSFR